LAHVLGRKNSPVHGKIVVASLTPHIIIVKVSGGNVFQKLLAEKTFSTGVTPCYQDCH
jgi:hypothetical protein